MIISLFSSEFTSKSAVLNSLHVTAMSHLRQTAAILVAVAVFTSVAGSPRPEEAKNEIDNTIPKVRIKTLEWYIKLKICY
jgi:hypothetical protein